MLVGMIHRFIHARTSTKQAIPESGEDYFLFGGFFCGDGQSVHNAVASLPVISAGQRRQMKRETRGSSPDISAKKAQNKKQSNVLAMGFLCAAIPASTVFEIGEEQCTTEL